MSAPEEPDLDRVRNAMREHDERLREEQGEHESPEDREDDDEDDD
jgi:hypothetical protein